MMFNPKESIDFNGNTGPFLLYTYARIKSLIRKNNTKIEIKKVEINSIEKDLIKKIIEYPEVIRDSALSYNPSLICNYIFEMVKFHCFLDFFLSWVSVIKFLTSQRQLSSQSPLD